MEIREGSQRARGEGEITGKGEREKERDRKKQGEGEGMRKMQYILGVVERVGGLWHAEFLLV